MGEEEIRLPHLSEITSGVRTNPRVGFIFFEYFLPGVVGRKKFKNLVGYRYISKFVTISYEAFAILLLENSWEKWEDEVEKRTKDPEKVAATKWTSSKNQGKRYCGWKKEGIKRFNELCNKVREDRIKDMKKPLEEKVEHRYCKLKFKMIESKEKKNKKNDDDQLDKPSERLMAYQDNLDLEDEVEQIAMV